MDITGGGLLFRRDALEQGHSDNDLRTHKRRRTIECANRGLYLPEGALSAMNRRDQHLVAVRGSVARSGPTVVVSRQSAAMLHGFDMWNPDLELVQLGSPRTSGGHVNPIRHLHADGLVAADVIELDGLRATTAARTIADLAGMLEFEPAVCVGDSAMRLSGVTGDEIADAVTRTSPSARRRATEVLNFLDPRAESIGESRSRVYLDRHGFPPPRLQVTLYGDDGREIARPDFLWEEEGVIGEFDGMVKYTDHVRPGETAAQTVMREKQREDLLRSYGWIVVRWTWRELSNSDAADRIARCFAMARGLPAPTTRVAR